MVDIASLIPTGCPKGIQPHEWRETIAARIDTLADQMCALIEVLDQMDGDPDLEPNGDELDVSWPEGFRPFDTGLGEDAEDDDAHEDDDPGGGDINDEPHDAADCGDDEPNLGWTEKCSQGRDEWAKNPEWTENVDPDGDVSYSAFHLEFDGNGHHDGNALLRKHCLPTVRVSPGVGRGW